MLAIKATELTKAYRIYKKPSDRLKAFFFRNTPTETFTALDRVSFSVNKGETFGIIGENGAGKSTLLKIISSTLTPTSGSVEVAGTVLSILELGVGFHPEFTGRENIFFYGDVLGFRRDFIRDKIDEIIGFSELGNFIDKPVRTYSSGMFMRLAFSIVSSFEPDILVLDEVLAVGDIHFQKKSLNRILESKNRGRTILFCSHDTYHTRMICDRVMWLKEGRIAIHDETERVVSAYESYQFSKDECRTSVEHPLLPVMFDHISFENTGDLKTGDTFALVMNTKTRSEDLSYNITISIKLPDGRGVYVIGTHLNGIGSLKGQRTVKIVFPNITLLSGDYYVHARIFDETGLILYHERVTPFFSITKNTPDMGICTMQNIWDIK
jgi:lipopolysaccharide transport system ATP-binding protein